ncbi:MAG: histidine--tRNA ligase [Melioribacteraceae bacterium]|nr:histidine--tRNA ligase [Melioribacteraceae bacterium]
MIKTIAGTKDTLPFEISKWQYFENFVEEVMSRFNYKEIRTPVFEETSLFARGIGESTDIVSKEMYTFLDRSQTSITLRPEMTASVMRSVLEHSLDKQQQLNKLYYISSMFRQERPQAGRLRQFNQFGAEAIGLEDPLLDAEMIIIAYDILKGLGLNSLEVKINSLGVPSSRENYKKLLRMYLDDKKGGLSEESKKRLDSNILRIFDSKIESDQKIMENAPLLLEHLDDGSLEKFETVKSYLLKAGVPFEIDPRLVRGLDYYTHTTFEIISRNVGSQSALCGGGRYDLLASEIGDRLIPAVGFAAGMERILLACENENCLVIPEDEVGVYIVRLNNDLYNETYNFALQLRRNSVKAELDYSRKSVKAQMREANKINARKTILFGGDEYTNNEIVIKDMKSGVQEKIGLSDIEKIISIIED